MTWIRNDLFSLPTGYKRRLVSIESQVFFITFIRVRPSPSNSIFMILTEKNDRADKFQSLILTLLFLRRIVFFSFFFHFHSVTRRREVCGDVPRVEFYYRREMKAFINIHKLLRLRQLETRTIANAVYIRNESTRIRPEWIKSVSRLVSSFVARCVGKPRTRSTPWLMNLAFSDGFTDIEAIPGSFRWT